MECSVTQISQKLRLIFQKKTEKIRIPRQIFDINLSEKPKLICTNKTINIYQINRSPIRRLSILSGH